MHPEEKFHMESMGRFDWAAVRAQEEEEAVVVEPREGIAIGCLEGGSWPRPCPN